MATIRKRVQSRSNGKAGAVRWQVRYYGPDGSERAKNFARRVDAQRFANSIEVDKLRGEWTDPREGRRTLGEWSTTFMATTTHLKPKTRASYESLLRCLILPRFENVPLARLEQIDVRTWVAACLAKGLGASRVRQGYNLLGAMLKAAVAAGYIAKTPCVGIKLPPLPKDEMQFLSADEVDRLAAAIAPPYDVLVYLLGYGGLRWGEAAALRVRRLQLLKGRIEIAESLAEVNGTLHFGTTKTHTTRTIAVPSFLRDRLGAHIAGLSGVDLVFTTRSGGPLRYSNFNRRVWKPALATAALPADLGLHALRHTCVALLIAQGAQPKEIQEHLGHSSIQVTFDRYGHLFPDSKDALADRLERAYRTAYRTAVRTENGLGDANVVQLHRPVAG